MARRRRLLENPRPLWIAGLAGAAVLLIGGIALASKGPSVPQGALGPAVQMNNAINANGYRQADMTIYKNFQQNAGLKVDGYPGKATYSALIAALNAQGVTPSSNLNPNYTFAPYNSSNGTGGFNGVTAPTVDQWFGPNSGNSVNAPMS